MNTIIEYLQAQKVTTSTTSTNPAIVVFIDATVVITNSTNIVVNTMTQPVVSQPICHPGPSRHATAYPWGLPPNFTPQFANGNAYMPYQPFVMPPPMGTVLPILGT